MWYQWLISLPMMVCLFWSIFFLVRYFKRNEEPCVRGTILLFFIVSTVLYTNHWLYFSDAQSAIGAYTYMLANLSVYPLYYAYLRALMRAQKNSELLVLFIPAAIMAVFYPLNRYFQWTDLSGVLLFTRGCFALQVIWVWGRGWQLIRATRQHMDATYSDDRSYLLHPMLTIQHLLGITAFFSSVLNFVGREFFEHEAPVAIPAIVMSLLLYSLGYVAAHTTLPQETVDREEDDEMQDTATIEQTDELMSQIGEALREQQLYADSRLTIQDLANAINSNRTYVSNCINRRTGLSFSQYIARYRVERAEEILRDPRYKNDHDAVADAIALSGFSSDQSFYRVFKEITGKTPIEFRKDSK